jgi:hypothetical protein
MRDGAAAVDEDADLAADLATDPRELAREVVAEDPVGGNAAPRQAFEGADLIGLESLGVPEDADRDSFAG